MTEWITRAQIGLRPRDGGGVALRTADVDGWVLHWPGMASPINAVGDAGFRRVCSALRGWQNYHMDVRGWSDIAYMGAVDQEGRKYTLRGINIKSGANGDNDVNTRFGAFLLVLAPGEKPSAKMVATAKEIGAEFCARFSGARLKPYGHQDVRPRNSQGEKTTDCPGPIAEAAINAGTFTPSASTGGGTPKPPAQEELFTVGQFETIMAKLNEMDTEASKRYEVESDRYAYYAGKFNEILARVAADDANDVTQADVDQILAEVRKLEPTQAPGSTA